MAGFVPAICIFGVVPAKAGTHNRRLESWLELIATSFFAPITACGYGSRIGARLAALRAESELVRDDSE